MSATLTPQGPFLDNLRTEGLTCLFQPIYEVTETGFRIFAVEGFCRGPAGSDYENDASGLFREARQRGIEAALDHICLGSLLRESRHLPAGDYLISLNFHPRTLAAGRPFFDYLCTVLSLYQVAPERVILELVEHTDDYPSSVLLDCLEAFRGLGGALAIDDLGQGHSNLRSVLDFQPEYLKIDRYVVHGCAVDRRRQAIIETCALLAERTGARLVAEGVESLDDLCVLRSLGLDLFQGYAFARPTPASEVPVREPEPAIASTETTPLASRHRRKSSPLQEGFA